jgi:dTDP-L-rhamnose 4-epimerase
MTKKNTILITGGAGFIGSNLALALLSRGHSVRVLDNLSPQIHGIDPLQSSLYLSIKDKVDFIRGDVINESDLTLALQDVDTVVHLAAETGTGQSMYAIKHYTDVNVSGTALLLEIIANNKNQIKRLVVASSRAVYGEGRYHCQLHSYVYPDARRSKNMERGDFEVHCPLCDGYVKLVPTDENTPVRPSSIYGITKLNQEQMFLTVGRAKGISTIAYRYQNVYGPGQSLSNPYTGILSIFSTRIRNEKGINIFEDGLESRDFVHIDDVVAATVAGIESADKIIEVFNVGSGVATNVLAVANSLQNLFNKSIPIEISGQFRIGDIRHNLADLSLIKKTLGWVPNISFQDGLEGFVDWAKNEAIQQDQYEESLTELKTKGLFK